MRTKLVCKQTIASNYLSHRREEKVYGGYNRHMDYPYIYCWFNIRWRLHMRYAVSGKDCKYFAYGVRNRDDDRMDLYALK